MMIKVIVMMMSLVTKVMLVMSLKVKAMQF